MGRKFKIQIENVNGEKKLEPLKRWIRENHQNIIGYVYDDNDNSHTEAKKLIELGYYSYHDEFNNYQILNISNLNQNDSDINNEIRYIKKNKQISILESDDIGLKKLKSKLKQDYSRRSKSGMNNFSSYDEFDDWYFKQEKKCEYCKIKEEDVRYIVLNGILKSKRFPENGQLKQGKARGYYLEVDRKDSDENYSAENCVLACYFCNNDKSDVFDFSAYKKFFQNRKQFLLQQIIKFDKEVNINLNKNKFQLKLGIEYYNKGIIEIPVEYKNIIPQEKGVKVKLVIDNYKIIYPTFTLSGGNRKINGKDELKEWFQKNFKLNDKVNVEIISETEFRVYK